MRRSLTLAWTVLFILSLLMQAGALANPPSALAVHEGLFELDGNAVNAGGTPGDDWDQVFAGTSSAINTEFITDPVDSSTDGTFTGGSTKDDLVLSGWAWSFGKAPAKNDIVNAFAAAYTNPANGHTIAYFGLDKWEADGTNFAGFWFFKNTVGPTGDGSPPGTPFSGSHAVGDILVLASYTNGGSLATFDVYQWVGSGGNVNGTLQTVATGVPCTGAPAADLACGATNGSDETAPWPFDGRDTDPGVFGPATFFEGGIDLTALNLDTGCFTSFMAETRASASVDAVLKDFANGSFSFCVTPTISTEVSGTSFVIGQGSVFDTAHLSGSKGVPTGTVDFFLCGPTGGAANCTSGGVDAGQDKVVNGSGDATSNAMAPAVPGWYCFRAEYTPTPGNHYLAVTHVLSTNECFQVLKASPAITTAANQTVLAGQSINDSATLSGGFSPTGTITFNAYGPDDLLCAGAVAFTTTVDVNAGNNSYGPVSFTPAVSGVYRWIASYGGDANNNAAVGLCNDTGETDTVNKVTPTITTSANQTVTIGAAIHDSATLSGGVSPTGTITFDAYGPNDALCSGAVLFTTSVAVSGNATYGPVSFTPAAVGVYRWIASYSGDGNNSAVSGDCNDAGETDTVNKTDPTIATVLHGGGEDGTSITVLLGTAVTDSSSLTGATADAGGTVHYQVFSDSDCETLVFDAGTKTVTNGVVPDSNAFTINVSGTYYWQADYSGDAKNNAASSACNLEIVTVAANIPTIVTSANETVTIGDPIHDTATLSGGFNPTGTITFKVWNNDTCTGGELFMISVPVNGNGTYGPVSFFPSAPGVYHWIASYSGDANNAAVSGGCGDAGENDTVEKASPSISTNAAGSFVIGGAIWDVATLSGGVNPTGTITFNLWGPDNATCTGEPIFTDTATVSGNGSYTSDSFTTAAAGTYRWIASYGGDANNNAVSGTCNDPNESINQPRLTILKDVAGFTGGNAIDGTPIAKVGDTLTYTLTYDITSPPAHNGVITDVVPTGLDYVTGSATNNAEFTFASYNAGTRTLTWTAPLVSADGTLSFRVTVLATAPDLAQPIVNVAVIDSDETVQDDDDAKVLVQKVLAVTAPPTATLDQTEQAPSSPGFSLMLILLALAAFVLSLGYVTPVPERARRRTEGRRR